LHKISIRFNAILPRGFLASYFKQVVHDDPNLTVSKSDIVRSQRRLIARTAGHDQSEPGAGQALVEEGAELRIEIVGADCVREFDAAGPADALDVERGRRPAPGIARHARMCLKARGDRGSVVEDDHQDVAPLVDGVDDGRQRGMEERRVAEEGDRALADAGPRQALGDTDGRADGKLGVDAIGRWGQAARVGDKHRVLPQGSGYLTEGIHDHAESAAGAVVLARGAFRRLALLEVAVRRREARQKLLEGLLDLPCGGSRNAQGAFE
jgi:hypothetical protein